MYKGKVSWEYVIKKDKVIIIKRIISYLLFFLLLTTCFTAVIGKAISHEASYNRGSCRSTIYSRDVPIYISVSYTYEEDESENEGSFKRKRIIGIESTSASCKHLDYTGNLNATASYTDNSIFVSVYGSLTNKKNSDKNFIVNETFTMNIT